MVKHKILVVDDESRMRKLISDFLIRNNYDVKEAEDGEQAVDMFCADKDIVLSVSRNSHLCHCIICQRSTYSVSQEI